MTSRGDRIGSALAKAIKGTAAKMKETAPAAPAAESRPAVWTDPRVILGMKAQLAARRQRIATGETPAGWKLGFGAPATLDKMAISGPLAAYLMQGAIIEPGATVSLRGWARPVAEPEIAVRLNGDLPAGATAAEARAAIASITPAIELLDLDPVPAADKVAEILAGGISQRHVVLGADSRAGGDTAGLSSHVSRRGALAAETADPEQLTGRVPDMLAHLAGLLGAFGERLRAGDLVICGSSLPPAAIEPDETDFTFELRPVGAVSVRFAR